MQVAGWVGLRQGGRDMAPGRWDLVPLGCSWGLAAVGGCGSELRCAWGSVCTGGSMYRGCTSVHQGDSL